MDDIAVVIIPPEPAYSRILELKRHYSEILHSTKALGIVPHITLVSLFKTNEYLGFLKRLRIECSAQPGFDVELSGLRCFDKPHVLYYAVAGNRRLQELHELCTEIAKHYRLPWIADKFLSSHTNREQQELMHKYGSPYVRQYYTPHVSIAGSDVDEAELRKLNAAGFPEQRLTFTVDAVHILKKVDATHIVDKRIPLSSA